MLVYLSVLDRIAPRECILRAATTELNESDDACDAIALAPSLNPVLDDADNKLRHSRVHLRPLLPAAFSVAFRPTRNMIHFPDCPIVTGVSRRNNFFDPLLRRSLCGRWEGGGELEKKARRARHDRMEGSSGGGSHCPLRPRRGIEETARCSCGDSNFEQRRAATNDKR
jgi:hypothetical protein